MLLHLHVKNLALIEDAQVEFAPGLNILTGETGAGKSILLGSMQLILGAKVSKSLIRTGTDHALVELLFQVEEEKARLALKELGIELDEGQLVLSRKISEGRSINRINGETTTLGKMKEVAQVLLDIHGQHEGQSLLQGQRQLEILDAYGKEEILPAKEKVCKGFRTYREINSKIRSMNMDPEARSREIAYLEYEIEEIEKAALRPGEDVALEEQYKHMSESQSIREALGSCHSLLGPDSEASEAFGEACRLLRGRAGFDKEVESLAQAAEEMDSLLGDFQRELSGVIDGLSFSEEEYYQVSRRLDLINSLKSRYGQSLEEIGAYLEKQRGRLDTLRSYEETLEELGEEAKQARRVLDASCQELSLLRKKYAQSLTEKIVEGLKDLNFLDVQFQISFVKRKSYREDGYDEIQYQISTNPGTKPGPLGDIVSGGELSRIMLAIKAILASRDHIETLIFDEIDTGISGRTAQRVSEKMAYIGRNRQVLCITHLPQIAAMADSHYEIEKHVDGELTTTQIHRLDEKDSIRELARLLSGSTMTEAVLENAAEMKRLAGVKKEELRQEAD